MVEKLYQQVVATRMSFNSGSFESGRSAPIASAEAFDEWVLNNHKVKEVYFKLIYQVMSEHYFNNSDILSDTNALIVFNTDAMAAAFQNYLRVKLSPAWDIGVYKKGSKWHPASRDLDILIITPAALEVGIFIPNVKTIINLDSSILGNAILQLLGRFDISDDACAVNYIYCHLSAVPYHRSFYDAIGFTLRENVGICQTAGRVAKAD